MDNAPEIGSVVRFNDKWEGTFGTTWGDRRNKPYIVIATTKPGEPDSPTADNPSPACAKLIDYDTRELLTCRNDTETRHNLFWWGFLKQDVFLTAAAKIVKSKKRKGKQ